MDNNTLKNCVTRLAEPVVSALGLVIWGVEIVPAGRTVVRLFVDTPCASETNSDVQRDIPETAEIDAIQDCLQKGPSSPLHSATLDQCEEISRHLALALDVEDCLTDAYVLEVSTPGLSRQFFDLSQMAPYTGDMVEAHLHSTGVTERDKAGMPCRRIRGILQAIQKDAYILTPASVSPEGDIMPEKDAKPVRIAWEATRKVKRMHIFKQPQKPGKRSPNVGKSGRNKPSGRLAKG
ncbi:MAG: ribosome maturation factor RimP [Desulfovibrio sp.]|nr:ribosome maturation factor RimP [Desulfovibrio sp.]